MMSTISENDQTMINEQSSRCTASELPDLPLCQTSIKIPIHIWATLLGLVNKGPVSLYNSAETLQKFDNKNDCPRK